MATLALTSEQRKQIADNYMTEKRRARYLANYEENKRMAREYELKKRMLKYAEQGGKHVQGRPRKDGKPRRFIKIEDILKSN